MIAATIAQTSLPISPTPTHSDFSNALATAFTNAGMGNPIDTWIDTNGYTHNTFKIVGNASAAKGTIYFDAYVANDTDVIYTAMYDGWDLATHHGTNGGSGVAYPYLPTPQMQFSLSSSQPIKFYAINHPEFRVVRVTQLGGNSHFFGILRPANIPAWWDENFYAYAFMLFPGSVTFNNSDINISFLIVLASTGNPLNSSNDCYISKNPALVNVNVVTNKPDILPCLFVSCGRSNSGYIGRTSEDLVQVPGSGKMFGDVFQVTAGVEEYTVIAPWNGPSIAIRTT